MSITHFLPTTSFLFFLFILASVTTALYSPVNLLTPRQQQVDQSICDEYSTVANLSIVAANNTYRAAYLQASAEGTDQARAPLDDALARNLIFNSSTQVNDECGNLTQVALEGAETNFTQGVVLQFNVNSAVQIGSSTMGMGMGMAMAMIMAMVVVMVIDVI